MGVPHIQPRQRCTSETLVTTVTGPPPVTTTLTDRAEPPARIPSARMGRLRTGAGDRHGGDGGLRDGEPVGRLHDGAVHNGSDNRGIDTGSGLASALGGQDVHGLEFTGAEEQAIESTARSASTTTTAPGPPRRPAGIGLAIAPVDGRLRAWQPEHGHSGGHARGGDGQRHA